MIKLGIAIGCCLMFLSRTADAQMQKADIDYLVSKVLEVCAVPTKLGQVFAVTGSADGRVGVKIAGLEGDFSIEKRTWEGLRQKFDTSDCVQSVLPLLLENYRPAKDTKSLAINCSEPVQVLNVQSGAAHKVEFLCGPIDKTRTYKVSFIGQVWGENVPDGTDSWITIQLFANDEGTKKPNLNVGKGEKRGSSLTINYRRYDADQILVTMQLDHCQHGGDFGGKNSWCSYSGQLDVSASP